MFMIVYVMFLWKIGYYAYYGSINMVSILLSSILNYTTFIDHLTDFMREFTQFCRLTFLHCVSVKVVDLSKVILMYLFS